MRIYLSDLGHNVQTKSSDVYPLAVANLATYAHAFLRVDEPVDISLFREPQDLRQAIDASPPDVLALSSYSWNHNLSLSFARYSKARSPNVLTLMGGPNFPLTRAEQETFLRGMPEIDVAVRGPTYEAERAFLNVIQRFSDVGHSLEGLQEEPVPASIWIDSRTGDFVHGGEIERIRDLDDIPSPYVAGLMDPFFETGYFPLLQISRGCPFTCAFCNSAVKSNNKVFRHSIDNVQVDLLYIAKRVRRESPLCLADDNFGMYPWDEEVADYLGYLQDHFGWPQYIRTTTGKNKSERIIRVMRKTRGAMPMTSAVQSLNPEVLTNIKRDNISLDTYSDIQREVRAQGMQSYGELILGLPGETKASFMRGIENLLETGVTRISAHQLLLLHGAPLNNPDSREQFGFKTKFRVVARNIGDYTGEKIIETEEVVVETPTLSFEEYLEARVFHLLLTIFHYEGNFEEAFQFAGQQGIKVFDLIELLQSMLNQSPTGFKNVIDGFVQESKDELFDTHDECVQWTKEHWEEVLDGTLGGNLLSKYSMLGRFFVTQDALEFLKAGIETGLGDSCSWEKVKALESLMNYLRCVLLQVPFAESLQATPGWETEYQVEAWRDDGYVTDLENYKFPGPRSFDTVVAPELKRLLENRLETFGEHPSGLGKFTRTMFARDLRRAIVQLPVADRSGATLT